MKKRINTKHIVFIAIMLLALSGCARIQGADGQILPEKIISLSTPFNYVIQNEGWFEAIFVWPVAQLINFFANYMNVGLAVIVVTILSRLLTLSFTVKSTVASQKMQMIQPEMTRIQQKYAGKTDDASKMAMSQETMKLYEKHKINPFGTILMTFVQFPVMIAIWQAVQRAESVINGKFLGLDMSFTPLNQITTDLAGSGWKYIILLVILAAAQYGSMKLPTFLARRKMKERDRIKAKAADQTAMMTNVMFVMIVFMALSMPTAMSFYWIVSSTVQIIQTLFIQNRYVDNEKV